MTAPLIKRRTLLLGTAGVIGGTVAWKFRGWQVPGHPLAESSAARRIGARFARTYTDDPAEFWQGPVPSVVAEWGSRLEQLRLDDFNANRLVEVDGWWLAETEVRFCVYLHALG